jgi:hypothetical protein
MSSVKIPTTLIGLTTRHNFHKGCIEYSIDLVILGKKFSVRVTEDFVARLDAMIENDVVPQTQNEVMTQQHEVDDHEDIPSGYSLGALERDPEDYSYEEISKL